MKYVNWQEVASELVDFLVDFFGADETAARLFGMGLDGDQIETQFGFAKDVVDRGNGIFQGLEEKREEEDVCEGTAMSNQHLIDALMFLSDEEQNTMVDLEGEDCGAAAMRAITLIGAALSLDIRGEEMGFTEVDFTDFVMEVGNVVEKVLRTGIVFEDIEWVSKIGKHVY